MPIYEILQVLDKCFIFFPHSLILIDYDGKLEFLLKRYTSFPYDEIPYNIKNLLDIENSYKKSIKQFKNLNFDIKSDNFISGAQINTIYECNMKCKYCFAGDGSHYKSSKMTLPVAKKIIDFIIARASKKEVLPITIIGGEPLMNFETMKFILEYGEKISKETRKNIRFSITSNGTLIDNTILETIDDYYVYMMISQDSNQKIENDKLRVMKNQKLSQYDILSEKKKKLLHANKLRSIHITVTPKNLYFFETAKSFFEEGFFHVHIDLVKSDKKEFLFNKSDISIIIEEFEKLTRYIIHNISNDVRVSCFPLMTNLKNLELRIPKISKCNVLNGLYAFSPDGEIYPCDMLMWSKYKLGDINSGFNEDAILDLKQINIKPNKCKY